MVNRLYDAPFARLLALLPVIGVVPVVVRCSNCPREMECIGARAIYRDMPAMDFQGADSLQGKAPPRQTTDEIVYRCPCCRSLKFVKPGERE